VEIENRHQSEIPLPNLLHLTMVRFACVGTLVAVLYVILSLMLRLGLNLSPVASATIAFALSVAFQYLAHSTFTFRRPARDLGQFARFVVTVLLGYGVSTVFLGWVAPHFGLGETVAFLINLVLLPLMSYLVLAFWVFGTRIASDKPPPTPVA
jgi:putative flippase GtrA